MPADSFTLGENDGNDIQPYTLTGDQLLGDIDENDEIFMIDPWETAYVYEYPRSDRHNGYLLFSKGPDKDSSSFTSELTVRPKNSRSMKIIYLQVSREMVSLVLDIKL